MSLLIVQMDYTYCLMTFTMIYPYSDRVDSFNDSPWGQDFPSYVRPYYLTFFQAVHTYYINLIFFRKDSNLKQ